MNETSLNELLERLGLTEYESKTLSTLFRLEEAEAPDISRLSQVPKTRVYDVLDKLVKRNIVIEIRGRPKKYRVLDSKKVLDTLLEGKKDEIREIEAKSGELVESLKSLEKSRAAPSGEAVMKVKDARDFEKILSQEIAKADNSVIAFAEITDKHNVLKDAIAKVTEKNVPVKILNAFPEMSIKKSVKELRQFEHGLNAFVIDGKKVIIALNDFKKQMPEYHFAIWHENKPIANALKHYFEKLWPQGRKL